MPHLVYFLLNAMPLKSQLVQKFFFLLYSQRKYLFPLPCKNWACQMRQPQPSHGWERIIVKPDIDPTRRAPRILHGAQCCGQSWDKGVKRNPKKYEGKASSEDSALSAWQPFFPLHLCGAIRAMGEALTAWAALCGWGSGGQEGPHFPIKQKRAKGKRSSSGLSWAPDCKMVLKWPWRENVGSFQKCTDSRR